MSFKSSTPKKEECIMPIQILMKKDLQKEMNTELFGKNQFPKRVEGEYHSVDVITCDEDGLLNIGFYNFDTNKWIFHTDTLVDYYEEGNEMNFVWMYAPIELLTYLEQKR